MTHRNFDPNSIDWSRVVTANNPQEGYGKYFEGTRYQRGFGNMSGAGIFHNIIRFLQPIAKNIAYSAGSEGLAAGTRLLKDVAEGRDLKESMAEHSQQGLQNLAGKLQQCGRGGKIKTQKSKKRTRPRTSSQVKGTFLGSTNLNLVPPIGSRGIGPIKRRRRPDQFDL